MKAYTLGGKRLTIGGNYLIIGANAALIGYPKNISAQEITDSSVIILWDEPDHENDLKNYKLYKNGELIETILDVQDFATEVTDLDPDTSYDFAMTAEDIAGNISALSPALRITTHSADTITPQANFAISPGPNGTAPYTVSVQSFSTPSDGTIQLHTYSWGDGSPDSTGHQNSHEYTTPGTYVIRLTIKVNEVDYFTEQSVIISPAVLDEIPPTFPGKPIFSTSTQSSISFSFEPGTDNIGVDGHEVYAAKDTPIIPDLVEEIHFGGVQSANLDSGVGFVQNVYPVLAGQEIDDPNGIILKLDVTNDFPNSVENRVEIREINNGSTIENGKLKVYNSRFDLLELPTVIKAPVLFFQLFAKELDGPALEMELTGEDQFAPADQGKVQVIDSFTGAGAGQRVVTDKYLQARNDLMVLVYFDDTEGWFKVILNGVVLREVTGINTSAGGNDRWAQFGLYPHGFNGQSGYRSDQVASGEFTFSMLMHSFSIRTFANEIPLPGDFFGFDFNLDADLFVSGSEVTDTALNANEAFRYALLAKDVAGNLSAPSLSDTFLSAQQAEPNGSYPTDGLIADVPFYEAERTILGSKVLDKSGNGNHITFSGETGVNGIIADGEFTPDSFPPLGKEMTFVSVVRYWNNDFKRTFQFGGGQNSLFFEKANMTIRHNKDGGVKERKVGFMANSQPSWFHCHIVIIRENGTVELYRSMLEPMGAFEFNSNSQIDWTKLIEGQSLEKIDIASGKEFRDFKLYNKALNPQELANLQAFLLSEHRDPKFGGEWPDMAEYSLVGETNFAAVTDPEAQARTAPMGSCAGGVKLDRTSVEDYEDQNGLSKRCLSMPFDNTHGGWNKGQRFMHMFPDISGIYEDMIIEWWYLVGDGLDLKTSQGAKMATTVSFGGVPAPCQGEIPKNKGYIAMMHRPVRRNLIEHNTQIDGAVIHGYNYFNGAKDTCGEHSHCYNTDGSFYLLKNEVWLKMRHRIKLNDIGQANGLFQIQIDDELKQSNGYIEMRDGGEDGNLRVKLEKVTSEWFSGGRWAWNGSGNIKVGDIKVYAR